MMTRYRHVRVPLDTADAHHIRALAAVMMQHHVNLRWWDPRDARLLVETYVAARAYARRSMEGPRPRPVEVTHRGRRRP